MKHSILTIARWSIFLGALLALIFYVSIQAEPGSGQVQAVCMQTQNDADSILIWQEGVAMLIDTGEEQDAQHILAVMKEQSIEELDYLILTHPDKDHIGGALEILRQVPVGQVIQPYDTEKNALLDELNGYCLQENISIFYPSHTRRLKLGQMRVLIYPPLEKNYRQTNNYSLAVLISHEKVNMLFTGDALRKRSEELMHTDWPEISLYKVPHHGRANSASITLLQQINPKYAVVTSKSADNAIEEECRKMGVELVYTGERNQLFCSDGESLKLESFGNRGAENE